MGTKEVAFAAKIPTLQDACQRIMNNSFPQPSPAEISNNLKTFSQVLLGVLKDVPPISYDKICNPVKDKERISLFPNLDYKQLFVTLVQLLELLPQVQLQASIQTIGQALLQTLSCLIPFLEHDYLDTLPYLISTSIAVLPNSLHKDLLDLLCYNLLPITVNVPNNRILQSNEDLDQDNFTNVSIPSILMNVFFYTEPPAFNSRLLETLMQFRSNILKDIFCVIAYGTVKSKCTAVELLFQYWPQLNPSNAQDRKQLADKHAYWHPVTCQYDKCNSKISNEAVKMCIDYNLAINSSTTKGPVMLSPVMLICIECADVLYKGKSRDTLIDMLLPMESISFNCENKACRSPISQKMAIATCFSIECANYNCSKAVRYCNLCNQQKHGPNSNHMVHAMIESAWKIDAETQCYFIEAIISLLKEAQPVTDKSPSTNATSSTNAKESGGISSNNFGNLVNFQSLDSAGGQSMNLGLNPQALGLPTDESQDTMALEERHLLSRYGIWLITQLCTPTEQTNDEVLGRLLAMLFQWFHYTACLPDDQAGSALERLKGECIQGWLMKVVKIKFNTFANCLLPHPSDCAKVSGFYDCWPSITNQIKEGFKRLICLVPYDIITFEVWSYIMPYWMESFRHEMSEPELAELKILLSKVLDPDLSPLGFKTSDMYKFITLRFENTTSPVQEQTLYWIQILTLLEVPIPLKLLLDMFKSGVESLKNYTENPDFASTQCKDLIVSPTKLSFKTLSKSAYFKSMVGADASGRVEKITNSKIEDKDIYSDHDKELNLNCFILMLDILIKQMELQEVTNQNQKGLEKKDSTSEVILNLLISILSTNWSGKHTCEFKDFILNLNSSFLSNVSNGNIQVDSTQCAFCELCSIWFQLALQLLEFFCPTHEVPMTEKSLDSKSVEIQPLDVKKMDGLSNNLRESSERQTRESDSGEAKDHFNLKKSVIEEETDEVSEVEHEQTKDEFDDYPDFENLPTPLKLLHLLLKSLQTHKNSDVIYHIVYMIKKLCLHAEVLSKAAKDHLDYLSYAQDKLLIISFYELLQSEFSHISELSVPLLLHSLLLPYGKEKFWNLIRKNFTDLNWAERFTAVERVTTIAHFLDINFIKNALSLQNSLANCFAYLVQCLDDIEATVSQRTLLNLECIRTNSLKLMISCLELQFDTMILDRPIILQTIFQLYNHLSERRFLTWDFFLNRFDALFLEAQVVLQSSGEITYTRDLKNSNQHSEAYQKKLERAQMALNNAKNLNLTLSSTATTTTTTTATVEPETSKLINEKQSSIQSDSDQLDDKTALLKQPAPILRRKASKISGTGSTNLPEKFQHFPNTFCATDNQFKQQMTNEEAHCVFIVYRIFDKGEQDRETMHSLVFLLMQFLSRPDQSQAQEEKSISRTQQIVIKHISILLGFSPSEKQFLISPNKLRKSPVFNSVITSLPKILDYNHRMGNLLASTLIVPLLIYAPSPQRFVGDYFYHPFNGNTNLNLSQNTSSMPYYSLFMLEPHVRESWLMAVQVLFYKYQYTAQPLHKQVHMVIQIIINTLESQFHLNCRPMVDSNHLDQGTSPARTRSRDLSNESIELENVDKQTAGSEDMLNRQLSNDETSMSEEDENESQADNSRKSDSVKPAKEEMTSRKLSKLFGKEDAKASFDKPAKSISPKHKSLVNRLNLECSFRNKSPSETAGQSEKKKSKSRSIEPETNGIEMKTFSENLKTGDATCSPEKTNSLDKLNQATRSPIKGSSKSVLSVKPLQERLLPIGTQYVSNKIDSSVSIDFPLPITERLLPIGPSPKHQTEKHNKLIEIKKQDSTTESQHSPKEESTEQATVNATIGKATTIKQTAIVKPKLKTIVTPDSSNDTVNSEDKQLDTDLPKSPLTITTSLPLETTKTMTGVKTSIKQMGQEGSIDVNYDPSLSPIKSQKEKSLSESKVDKVEKFRFGEMKKQLNSIQTTSTFGSSGTSISIDIPEDDVLKDGLDGEQIKSKASRHYKQRKARKQMADLGTAAGNVQRKNRKIDQQSAGTSVSTPGSSASINDLVSCGEMKQIKSSRKSLRNRTRDESLYEYCMTCNQILEEFSEHELDLCITILGTFLNREPAMAAPLIPLILSLMSKYAIKNPYSWQNEYNTFIHVPGNIRSVAKQLIRCILQNFSTNGIFQQLFTSFFTSNEIFRAITIALADYTELNVISPLNILFKDLIDRKHLPNMTEMQQILTNAATYMESIQPELANHSGWSTLFPILETFFRKLSFNIPPTRIYNLNPLIRIMLQTIRLPAVNSYKTILEIYSKMLSQIIQQSPLDYELLLELCHLNCKTFAKERDRLLLTRTVVYELVNCLKSKNMIPDENVMILIQFLLQDGDGTLVPSTIIEGISSNMETHISDFNTLAQEAGKQHVGDLIEFISDVHSLSRIKKTIISTNLLQLTEEMLGAQIKAGISQYLSIEMTRRDGQDHRAVIKYLPWLYSLPTVNQARDFLECVSHIRLLSWLLHGSISHTVIMKNSPKFHLTQPIPLEANGHIAENIQIILSEFPEQANLSVLHMTSLFHAFVLCQLWTMYCETIAEQNQPGSEQYNWCTLTLCDFWSKVTPNILQLICSSKQNDYQHIADTVTLHFLRLLEALMECNSNLLTRLLPCWIPVFQTYPGQLTNQLQSRLEACINWTPPLPIKPQNIKKVTSINSIPMLKSLQELQIKMAKYEFQCSSVFQIFSKDAKRN